MMRSVRLHDLLPRLRPRHAAAWAAALWTLAVTLLLSWTLVDGRTPELLRQRRLVVEGATGGAELAPQARQVDRLGRVLHPPIQLSQHALAHRCVSRSEDALRCPWRAVLPARSQDALRCLLQAGAHTAAVFRHQQQLDLRHRKVAEVARHRIG